MWYDRTIETNKLNQVVKEKQNMSENKETKQEVTNEQILEHLKEIEIAQGCIANGINTLFIVMSERKEQLKLSMEEVEMIEHGQIAFVCLADRMADISGMNEKIQNLDFLKEILS